MLFRTTLALYTCAVVWRIKEQMNFKKLKNWNSILAISAICTVLVISGVVGLDYSAKAGSTPPFPLSSSSDSDSSTSIITSSSNSSLQFPPPSSQITTTETTITGVTSYSITSTTSENTTNSRICCGVSEDYELALTYQTVPSNLTQAWIDYYTNSTFQSLKTKFGWNVIRLSFKFSANDFNSSEQYLNVSNIANLDLAVSMAAQYGFKVILDDLDYQNGFYGSSAWYYDWNVTAEHYKGDSNIVLFNVANEMEANNTGTNNNGCGSIGTEAIVCLDKVTAYIRSIDPSRAVGWWVYSITGYPTAPPADELFPNTYADLHVSIYGRNSTCATLSRLEYAVTSGLNKFQSASNMTGLVGEINIENNSCNSVSSAFIQYLVQNNVPWIACEYSLYSANWISILDNVNVTSD